MKISVIIYLSLISVTCLTQEKLKQVNTESDRISAVILFDEKEISDSKLLELTGFINRISLQLDSHNLFGVDSIGMKIYYEDGNPKKFSVGYYTDQPNFFANGTIDGSLMISDLRSRNFFMLMMEIYYTHYLFRPPMSERDLNKLMNNVFITYFLKNDQKFAYVSRINFNPNFVAIYTNINRIGYDKDGSGYQKIEFEQNYSSNGAFVFYSSDMEFNKFIAQYIKD